MSDVALKTGAQEERILRISRLFAAPREAVFRAWTDPEALVKWWGPQGCTARAELDPRTGGKWRSVMVHSDGEENIVGGVYLEISAPERLVFT